MSKILLVEDDNNLREIYEARLQAEGYTIVSARDGEEALVVAKAEKPDLIIADIMMPKISGFEMLDILRNTEGLKNVKVVMLTALGQSDDQQRANKLGADRYLVKSQVTLEDIVKTAHDLLADADGQAKAAPAPAESAAASDDKLMNDAVNSLIANTEKPAEPAKPPATPTATPAPAPAASDSDESGTTHVPVTHQKVIKPLEGEPKKDLNTLLAEEEAKEADSTAKSNQAAEPAAAEEASMDAKIEDFVAGATTEPTPPATPKPASTPPPKPKDSSDPNAIAL